MSASLISRFCLLVGALALLPACRTTTPTVGMQLLQPSALANPIPPTPLDRAVADLAAAALAGNRDSMDVAFAAVKRLHTKEERARARRAGLPEMSGLVPLCIDLMNSTLADPVEYREASSELLGSWGLDPDPALEARLERAIADDPLALANRRMRDHWETLFAKTFNAVSQPLGQSLIWGVAVAPFRLATSITYYAADLYTQPAMSVQERQALAHRKRFVAQHPDSKDVEEVLARIDKGEAELRRMQAGQLVRLAEQALEARNYKLAEIQADRALLIQPGHEDAAELSEKARAGRADQESERRRGDTFSAALPRDLELVPALEQDADSAEPPLANFLASLLASSSLATERGDSLATATHALHEREKLTRLLDRVRRLRDADPDGVLADEAEYLLALIQHDMGFGARSWERLRELARRDFRKSNMARHAQALIADPWQNTWGNFERQRRRATERAAAFRLLGGYAEHTRYPGLPRPLSFLIEAPAMAQAVLTAPLRLVFGPWDRRDHDYDRAPAIAAYRHLAREPRTRHANEAASWLYAYETQRENWGAVLKLYDLQPLVDPLERVALIEKAATQGLAAADRADRRDWRSSILKSVVREFPDSDASLSAGALLRDELLNGSPQRIRITRSFLEENPEVAGIRGLGLSPLLLDDDTRNGELHPEGVTFLGGQILEFALVPESGDKEDPPVTTRQEISAERLAQAVAKLDEAVLLNDQLDQDSLLSADAFRDRYLERAKLGLVSEPDMRATARSDYVYQSLRERYGLVRGRESILPFDLVFRGSLNDLSLGAFPRWRQPRKTSDAFMYR